MIQQTIENKQPKLITEKSIISMLQGMLEHRFNAVILYPSSKMFQNNIQLITQVRAELQDAANQMNYKSAVKICLRQELALLYLAPRSTVKIFTTYKEKLDFLMNACRVILNYQAQK